MIALPENLVGYYQGYFLKVEYDVLMLDKGNHTISGLRLDRVSFKRDYKTQVSKMIFNVISKLGYEVTNYYTNDKTLKIEKDINGVVSIYLWFSDDISIVQDFIKCWNNIYKANIWVFNERHVSFNGGAYIMLYGYFMLKSKSFKWLKIAKNVL